jgi:hypothetical protein
VPISSFLIDHTANVRWKLQIIVLIMELFPIPLFCLSHTSRCTLNTVFRHPQVTFSLCVRDNFFWRDRITYKCILPNIFIFLFIGRKQNDSDLNVSMYCPNLIGPPFVPERRFNLSVTFNYASIIYTRVTERPCLSFVVFIEENRSTLVQEYICFCIGILVFSFPPKEQS